MEMFPVQVILPLRIFAGGSLIVSELVCGLRVQSQTTFCKEPEFVFELPSILGRNEARRVVFNSSLESFKGGFFSTVGRLPNVTSTFEVL